MSNKATRGETLLLLGEGGLWAINGINVQPRLIKAWPEVVTRCHACASVCIFECVCDNRGDDRLVSPIKHLIKKRARVTVTYWEKGIFHEKAVASKRN